MTVKELIQALLKENQNNEVMFFGVKAVCDPDDGSVVCDAVTEENITVVKYDCGYGKVVLH